MRFDFPRTGVLLSGALFLLLVSHPAGAQLLIKSVEPGEPVNLLPSDTAALESNEARHDLPCVVTPRKADIGFDLRFHAGYDVTVPIRELEGTEDLLTIVFRVYEGQNKDKAAYFRQHVKVPAIPEDAKGDATLGGSIDIGEGNYHVDWLMRDRQERICSSGWDVIADLAARDKAMPLFVGAGEIAQSSSEPFFDEPSIKRVEGPAEALDVKLLVNFAPQSKDSAVLTRSDTDALVSILKNIQRDPHVTHVSLVAFNMQERRVVYRQDAAETIDFPALGKALDSLKLGTVDIQHLAQKNGETEFLQELIQKELGSSNRPDAVIFAGPKAMLNADVPQEDLRRIGDIECPVFYMNYNLNPQAVPWKDSISHAIRVFKGTEYTISRPRDLWISTREMLTRIVRAKRERVMAAAFAPSGSK